MDTLTLGQLKREVAGLTGHDLDQTDVESVELTAHGVAVHVDDSELRESLAEALADLATLRGNVRRWVTKQSPTLAVRELDDIISR